ncbi:MAG: PDZ domain-containing protein [Planctomycetota bacterium]
MNTPILALLSVAVLVLPSSVTANEDALSPMDKLTIVEAVQPALVHVEYHLRFDKGEAPTAAGWAERCPNCGQYHGYSDGENLVQEERPKEMGGFLLSQSQVLTIDPQIHPRFIKHIKVHAGQQLAEAHIAAYMRNQNAIILELAEPLADAQPLEFQPAAEGPYFTVTHQQANAMWATHVKPLTNAISMTDTGLRLRDVPAASLLVNKLGACVGVTMNAELPVDDSWKGAPLNWPAISAEEMKALLANMGDVVNNGVLHVTLKLRSPQKDQGNPWSHRWDEDDDEATEIQDIGVLLDENKLLVLAHLKPATTARLEQIQVRLPGGKLENARFTHTLQDFGCFIAELDKPRGGAVAVESGDVRRLRNELVLAAEIILYGESRQVRCVHARIPAFEIGYKRKVYPEVYANEENLYLFKTDGTLIAAPVMIREKSGEKERWNRKSSALTPLAYVTELLANLAKNTDPSNVPLSEAEENRVAWLGVELQNLDTDLARINNVSKLTEDGSTGALVSYVHPDSPASQANIKPGAILLRLHVEDYPKAISVQTDDYQVESFPWDQLDEVPEQYFDRIPKPWPSARNQFNRTLTDLGFGRKYTIELFLDGEIITREFEVVESPPHFDSAKRFKSRAAGLSVRDLTYEVRRYFQLQPDDPGVIVSKVESGSRASVAGIKPYELILSVNDQPIHAAAGLEKAIAVGGEFRLNVRRMTANRIVTLKIKAESDGE